MISSPQAYGSPPVLSITFTTASTVSWHVLGPAVDDVRAGDDQAGEFAGGLLIRQREGFADPAQP
jgi:hypothetical protein